MLSIILQYAGSRTLLIPTGALYFLFLATQMGEDYFKSSIIIKVKTK